MKALISLYIIATQNGSLLIHEHEATDDDEIIIIFEETNEETIANQ